MPEIENRLYIYMLSYDLTEESDYSRLLKELRRIEAKPILKSQWLFHCSNTPPELKKHFRSFIDDRCRFMICRISIDLSETAVYNFKIPESIGRLWV